MSSWKLSKIQYSFTETVTNNGTLILVKGSSQYQIFTGSASHTMRLPDATTMKTGVSFTVVNLSSGAILVQNNGLSTVGSVPSGATAEFVLTDKSTANGAWTTFAAGATADGGIGSAAPSSVKTSDYTIVSGDNGSTILVDTSSNSVNITLPAPSDGFNVTIKDVAGYASQNVINILRASDSSEIDGELNDDIIAYDYYAISYVSDGTDWYRVADSSQTPAIGLIAGGFRSVDLSIIQSINLVSNNNSEEFGNLASPQLRMGACASSTRALFAGGQTGFSNSIEYVEFTTKGNTLDFGDLTVARGSLAGCGSSTRGLFGGGNSGSASNVIDYVTIASTGNATDFGDLTVARNNLMSGVNSSTRGIWGGGLVVITEQNTIDYVTIATTGNATDFGDLVANAYEGAGCSNSVRGVFAGFVRATNPSNDIDYITIATTGNATNFGDLTIARLGSGGCSSPSKAVFLSGELAGSIPSTVIDYIEFSTLSNATDFGDVVVPHRDSAGCSNAHGGLF